VRAAAKTAATPRPRSPPKLGAPCTVISTPAKPSSVASSTGPRLSEATVYNGTAYLAGQVAADAKQDISGQTRQVLAEIDKLLAEVGSDKSRILMAQIFLADMADFAGMNEVWDDWVAPGDAPPRATVQAKLANPAYRIEIVVTAALKA
jgi:enamine deaminase RidA (YjgF/YER057c/UK114 family)